MKITKAHKIREHLKNKKKITSWEAIDQYGVTRLADNIFILRNKGWIIESKDVKDLDRYGNKSSFTQYELIYIPKEEWLRHMGIKH